MKENLVTATTADKQNSAQRLRIGLTGGIASGKTTVARQLGELGAAVIDTDVIARQVVEPGTRGLAAITARFGQDLLLNDGTLDRAALRELIFSSPVEKDWLENLLHPMIRAAALAQADTTAGDYLVYVVPLLLESGFVDFVDRILVVDCPEETQLARLLLRDGESLESAQRLIASQIDRTQRLAAAHDVIDNSDDLETLEQAVIAIHAKYLALASGWPESA